MAFIPKDHKANGYIFFSIDSGRKGPPIESLILFPAAFSYPNINLTGACLGMRDKHPTLTSRARLKKKIKGSDTSLQHVFSFCYFFYFTQAV